MDVDFLGEGMEECLICSKKHPKAFMAKHMRNRHSSKATRFPCQLCDKSFKSEELLSQHNKIHSGDKVHSCEHCGKSYVCKTNLKTHLLKVHQVGGKFLKITLSKFQQRDFFFILVIWN